MWQYFAAGEDPQRSVLFSDWVEFQLRTAQVNRSFIYPLRMWLGEDHFAHALFSSQLQDASDAMFEAFSMTEERLQAVSLACDDDGHDAPQPNKSVKPHP